MEGTSRDAPGQMSAEEARDLLDSAKSDEHQSLLVSSWTCLSQRGQRAHECAESLEIGTGTIALHVLT